MQLLINNSDNKFVQIDTEEWREYKTPFGIFRIDFPTYLSISDNGHRVLDDSGLCHYIDTRQGFFLTWKPKPGAPHFVK